MYPPTPTSVVPMARRRRGDSETIGLHAWLRARTAPPTTMTFRAQGVARATMENGSPPPAKRARIDAAALAEDVPMYVGGGSDSESDGNTPLEALVAGDDFVTEAQRQEAEARRRRELRRQRLAQLQEQEEMEHGTEDRTKGEAFAAVVDTTAPAPSSAQTPSEMSSASTARRNRDEDDAAVAKESDDDDFDMFSSSVSPVVADVKGAHVPPADAALPLPSQEFRGHGQADWDDAEGYYKAVIGETIAVEPPTLQDSPDAGGATKRQDGIRFRVSGLIGKGVFSTVLKCSTISNSSSVELPPVVALKCVRHNDTMTKAALRELQMLLKLKGAAGIVPLLLPTTPAPVEHRGHVLLCFSFMEYNLRDVLLKFGRGVGLSLAAVRSYCGQLLAALTQLRKHGILHCDLKPDNILVSSDFGVCQIADFGSAVEAGSADNLPTPYLVSRFYRAPEVILGLQPSFAMDLWSVAVSVVELFLGDVLFRGRTNNDMLFLMMQHLGAVPNRVVRQHLVQAQRVPQLVHQFQSDGPNYSFLQQTTDPVTHATAVRLRPLTTAPTSNDPPQSDKFPNATPLHQRILKARSVNDKKSAVQLFSDLMRQCLALDPTRRIELRDAIRHDFFATKASTAAPDAGDIAATGSGQ